MSQGTLYLIPTFLTDDNFKVLPETVVAMAQSLKVFVVEEEKAARRFLKRIQTPIPQSELEFYLLNEHSSKEELPSIIQKIKDGCNIGLVSDAGCPGVADPGSDLVRLAHDKGIKVVPFVGPSSILLSLMASGFNGQSFCFHGYLQRDPKQRQQRIRELEKIVSKTGQTQIFIETPYRNMQLLEDLLNFCADETRLCIATELTGQNEIIKTREIAQWKKNPPSLNKKPCVFLIGK